MSTCCAATPAAVSHVTWLSSDTDSDDALSATAIPPALPDVPPPMRVEHSYDDDGAIFCTRVYNNPTPAVNQVTWLSSDTDSEDEPKPVLRKRKRTKASAAGYSRSKEYDSYRQANIRSVFGDAVASNLSSSSSSSSDEDDEHDAPIPVSEEIFAAMQHAPNDKAFYALVLAASLA